MGIKSLNKTLHKKGYSPNSFNNVHISNFSEKKIAIDALPQIYNCKFSVGDQWIRKLFYFTMSLRKYNVHPVFIFDSNSRPSEKSGELLKRKTADLKKKEKRDNLIEGLAEHAKRQHVTPYMMEKYSYEQTLPQDSNTNLLLGDNAAKCIDFTQARRDLEKIESQIQHVTDEDVDMLKGLLDTLQIPYLTANSEADPLCAKLCNDDNVYAAMSRDSDLFAYGCHRIIQEYNVVSGMCVFINFEDVLNELEMTGNEFRDFCIMCGTDFNDNIPGIGPVKSFKLIKKYGNIDTIAEMERSLGVGILNHKRTREIFGGCYNGDTKYTCNFCDIPDITSILDYIEHHNIRVKHSKLIDAFSEAIVIEPEDDFVVTPGDRLTVAPSEGDRLLAASQSDDRLTVASQSDDIVSASQKTLPVQDIVLDQEYIPDTRVDNYIKFKHQRGNDDLTTSQDSSEQDDDLTTEGNPQDSSEHDIQSESEQDDDLTTEGNPQDSSEHDIQSESETNVEDDDDDIELEEDDGSIF
ncbi:MAG: hypothetical protein JKX76_00765 [Colwellia sp.]|nr:hypothetical protein [Colwellia sp.]